MVLFSLSSRSVTSRSITCALESVYDVLTLISGDSTTGYSRMPRRVSEIRPKITITIEKTVARTGRRILTEDKLMHDRAGEAERPHVALVCGWGYRCR